MNDLLTKAWRLFSTQFAVFFFTALVSQILIAGVTYLVGVLDGTTADALLTLFLDHPEKVLTTIKEHYLYIGVFMLAFIVDICASTIVVYTALHPQESFKRIVTHALPYLPRVIGTSVITSLILLTGFFLFFIPGIIAAVFLAFASPLLVVARKLSVKDAIAESIVITKKHYGHVAMMLFGTLLCSNILILVWDKITASVASLPGASILISLVTQLIGMFATLIITYTGLRLMSEKQESA